MDRVRALSPSLSGAVHVVAAGILVFAPLFTEDRLPASRSFQNVAHAGTVPVVLLGGGGVARVRASRAHVPHTFAPPLHVLPLEAVPLDGIELGLGDTGPGGIGEGSATGAGLCLFDCDVPPGPAGLAPPGPTEPDSGRPLPVGGHIREPVKVRHVDPVYPPLALATRVEGAVVLRCVITAEGTVSEVTIVRGHVLLNDAAVAAVSSWRYRPTLLNGVPVSVILTVTVSFDLH